VGALVVFDRPPYARSNRCVICSLPVEAHSPEKSAHHFQTMNLPEDKTCGDCVHIYRCNQIFGHMATDERCDWFPIKFQER
jgi:hypothetical protein